MTAPPTAGVCPRCQASASGQFCSSCGAPLAGASCSACRSPLTPGAKFCHRCGTAVGAGAAEPAPARDFGTAVPWALMAIVLVAFIALLAGQHYSRQASAAAAAPVAAADAGDRGQSVVPDGAAPIAGSAGMAGVRAPDISSMSLAERAERLFNRVMSYSERGQPDSARFFAPMALAAYQMIGPLNADQRYDMGRVAMVAGETQVATAQADSILQAQPHHLLGLILAAEAARMRNDGAKARSYSRALAAAAAAEIAKQLPEYIQHENDITAAVDAARRR